MAPYRIHFSLMSKAEGDDNISSDTDLGNLVEPGALLVSVSPDDDPDQEVVRLEAGGDTELTQAGIVSCAFGYPEIDVRKKGDEIIVLTALRQVVFTALDMMEARLRLPSSIEQNRLPDRAWTENVLQEVGVCFGIDCSAIDRGLAEYIQTGSPAMEFCIARGRAPIDGRDSYLRMEVEIGPLPGTLLADGSIDFRERKMFVGVRKGELLATRIPAEKGRPGSNILGELVPAKDGREIQVKVSDDSIYNEEDGTVRATASGVLCVVGDNTLRVCSSQRIDGDVDYTTGNIRSQNSVEIGGSVLPGFRVHTRGNLVVGQNVEAGSIASGGNIAIGGGIVGASAKVTAKGDIDVRYSENATLFADGNIVIRASGYYSNLEAGVNIHCPEGGKLVGGRVVAGGSISASQIGGVATEPMEVIAGVDPYRFRRHQALLQEYHGLLQQIQRLQQFRGRSNSHGDSEFEILQRREKALAGELEKLNLIQGTEEMSLGQSGSFTTFATITVHEFLAGGTVLRIGNETMVTDRDFGACVVRLDAFNGGLRCVEDASGEVSQLQPFGDGKT